MATVLTSSLQMRSMCRNLALSDPGDEHCFLHCVAGASGFQQNGGLQKRVDSWYMQTPWKNKI